MQFVAGQRARPITMRIGVQELQFVTIRMAAPSLGKRFQVVKAFGVGDLPMAPTLLLGWLHKTQLARARRGGDQRLQPWVEVGP